MNNKKNSQAIFKKIASTKKSNLIIRYNYNKSTCNLSHTRLTTARGISLFVLNNNSKYVSVDYLKHKIFNGIKASLFTKIAILTLRYYGAEIVNCNNRICFGMLATEEVNYIIDLKNGISIYIYDNDARAKKYFNLLKHFKKSIKKITIHTHGQFINQKDLAGYPPFVKKMYEYIHYGGYNPKSKNDCIQHW